MDLILQIAIEDAAVTLLWRRAGRRLA